MVHQHLDLQLVAYQAFDLVLVVAVVQVALVQEDEFQLLAGNYCLLSLVELHVVVVVAVQMLLLVLVEQLLDLAQDQQAEHVVEFVVMVLVVIVVAAVDHMVVLQAFVVLVAEDQVMDIVLDNHDMPHLMVEHF